MSDVRMPIGRRERAKRDKRERIMKAARELFAEHGVGGVTTQQIADHADVAIGTLFRYAATKAELLIMVQNEKFAAAIDSGLAAAAQAAAARRGVLDRVLALIAPVVECVREQVENGRAYLNELVVGDPAEPHRGEGLVISARFERGITDVLTGGGRVDCCDAATFARVITAIIHLSTTAAVSLHRSDDALLGDIQEQVQVTLSPCSHLLSPHPVGGADRVGDRSPV